jgi:hypothetical protein
MPRTAEPVSAHPQTRMPQTTCIVFGFVCIANGYGFGLSDADPTAIQTIYVIGWLTNLLTQLVQEPSSYSRETSMAALEEWTSNSALTVCESLGRIHRELLWQLSESSATGGPSALTQLMGNALNTDRRRRAATRITAQYRVAFGDLAAPGATDTAQQSGDSNTTKSLANVDGMYTLLRAHNAVPVALLIVMRIGLVAYVIAPGVKPAEYLTAGILTLSHGLVRVLAEIVKQTGSARLTGGILASLANTLASHFEYHASGMYRRVSYLHLIEVLLLWQSDF